MPHPWLLILLWCAKVERQTFLIILSSFRVQKAKVYSLIFPWLPFTHSFSFKIQPRETGIYILGPIIEAFVPSPFCLGARRNGYSDLSCLVVDHKTFSSETVLPQGKYRCTDEAGKSEQAGLLRGYYLKPYPFCPTGLLQSCPHGCYAYATILPQNIGGELRELRTVEVGESWSRIKALTGRMRHFKYVRAKEVEVAIFEVL